MRLLSKVVNWRVVIGFHEPIRLISVLVPNVTIRLTGLAPQIVAAFAHRKSHRRKRRVYSHQTLFQLICIDTRDISDENYLLLSSWKWEYCIVFPTSFWREQLSSGDYSGRSWPSRAPELFLSVHVPPCLHLQRDKTFRYGISSQVRSFRNSIHWKLARR